MKVTNIKIKLNLLLLSIFILSAFYTQPSRAWWFFSINSAPVVTNDKPVNDKEYNEWLTKRFSEQHQQLIPVVAVADMFFMCDQLRKTDEVDYALRFLIDEMDKNTLAIKLSSCLGDDTMTSDVALNFGLLGCFHAQLAHLSNTEKEQKMRMVKQATYSLSHEERKKSFIRCVTEQSIHYLK